MKIENPYKNAEDKLLFAKVLDKYLAAEHSNITTHTDFLDPVRCEMFLHTLDTHKDAWIIVKAYGGYDDAERKKIVFHSKDDIITPITITYNQKFVSAPSHRDYLGAILGLGIDRGKIGDIRKSTTNAGAVVYVSHDIAHFITNNLTQVGRASVKAQAGALLDGLDTIATTKRITVPSMRLDAVLGAALNLSRGKSSDLIEAEKVYVNWKIAKKTYEVAVGDTITIRGVGRTKILAQGGNSKKGRIVLEVGNSGK